MKLSFWEVGKLVQAQNDYQQWPDFPLTGVEFDSRKISEGNLFVPLQGTRDGHDFIEAAIAQGAKASFWSQATAPNIPYLQVADVETAFQQLAAYYRQKMNVFVVGITGSNGKTTTKDMCASVLSQKYATYKTQGNYNNTLGLPYTILHMPDDTKMLVLEMGMDDFGQIEQLSAIAQPNIACITMIGESHIENLGSRAGIAQAKFEIMTSLNAEGTAILPIDEPLLTALAQDLAQKYKTFGLVAEADYYAKMIETAKTQTSFVSNLSVESIHLPVIGDYNVKNALLALAVGDTCGLSFAEIKQGLEQFQLTKNRTQWLKGAQGVEILSDVYNANPTAMKLIVRNFAQLEEAKRKIVVLGDMLELGPEEKNLHASVAEVLDEGKIAEVYLYGSLMEALYQTLKARFKQHVHYYPFSKKEALKEAILQQCDEQTMILFKASNGTNLAELVTYIQESE